MSTFNSYFASKKQAIAWLAGRHAAGMAATLRERPAEEPLGQALIEAVLDLVVGDFGVIELDRVAGRRPSLWLFGWRQALFSLAGGQYGSDGGVRQPRATAWSIRVRVARATIGRVSSAR